jgi:hypothetical protein
MWQVFKKSKGTMTTARALRNNAMLTAAAADLASTAAKIKELRLDSGKILFEKARKMEISVATYNENDILRHFSGKELFPFRNDDFSAHLQNRIAVLQIPECYNVPLLGLHWVSVGGDESVVFWISQLLDSIRMGKSKRSMDSLPS